jgi:uncharacterized protein
MFEWDEAKSRRNERERGLPFELAMAMFAGPTLERADLRRDYGERRIIAIGAIGGRCFVPRLHAARRAGAAGPPPHLIPQGDQRGDPCLSSGVP